MASKKKKLNQRQIKNTITKLVNKHGKVRIYFTDMDYEPPCDCLCRKCKLQRKRDGYHDEPDMRRRLLRKDGRCDVSYRSDGYRNWSGFSESCFMDNYEGGYKYDDYGNSEYTEPKLSVKETLKYMFQHDRFEWKPIFVEYGKGWKRKLKLA